MPTYEYACSSCGTHVEVFQRFNEEPLSKCGVCGGQLRKVFHPAGVLFKGSGFYKTDSRSSRPSPEKKAAGGSGPGATPPGKEGSSGGSGAAGSGSGSGSRSGGKEQSA